MRRAFAALPIVWALTVALAPLSAQQPGAAPVPKSSGAGPALAMTGYWDYNDALSVDSATGRPEQAPLSAAQRPRRGNPTPARTGGATGGGASGAGSPAGPAASGGGAAPAADRTTTSNAA